MKLHQLSIVSMRVLFATSAISLCSCGGKAQESADSTSAANLTEEYSKDAKISIEELNDDVIARLWQGIPDHGINEKTNLSLSKDFYALVNVANSLPSDNPGGISDLEDELAYWYMGQDGCENDRVTSVAISPVKQDDLNAEAKVTVKYSICGNNSLHNLVLTLENEKTNGNETRKVWRISEFDNKREMIYNIVSDLAPKFKNGYAKTVIEREGEYMSADEAKEYLSYVDKFIKLFDQTYPDGVIKK